MTTALIIDDSVRDRKNLAALLLNHQTIDIAEQCVSGEDGLKAIALHKPQLIFLDVEMPGMSGFEMLDKLKERDFEVIFTTAHSQYGLKALKIASLDYLLKPIRQEELEAALAKFSEKQVQQTRLKQYDILLQNIKQAGNKDNKIVLSSKSEMQFLLISSVAYCESDGEYTDFYFTDRRKITVSMPLKHYETLLADYGFRRIHNEYIVNPDHIEKAIRSDGLRLLVKHFPQEKTNSGDPALTEIPVSRSHRAEFEAGLII